jgi:hypothetical protein
MAAIFRLSAILVPLLFAGAAHAAETGAPAPVVRVGASEKVCQLTGDLDWETGRPTAARTLTNFGLGATDLGYPVEHNGKLILLFGDSRPNNHPAGALEEAPPDDAVGVTTRIAPPGDDGRCLDMVLHTKPGATKVAAPPTVVGPVAIKQGSFNVPSGGVSAGGSLCAFFWTNHCFVPTPLQPSPDAPLARPPPRPNCRENDGFNSIGSAVLAHSEDDGRTFAHAVEMPVGFVYATAVNTRLAANIPDDQRLGILVFAVPRYRASVPYLAQASAESLADPTTWRFFVGRDANGGPKWTTSAEWSRGAGSVRGWKPPGEAELFAPPESCVGEFSITWNRPLGLWLMLYNCKSTVFALVAPAPWGPWSEQTRILSHDDPIDCHLVMMPAGCGNLRNFWPKRREDGKFVAGGLYAPFVLNRFTTAGGGPGRSSTIYWVVSTWNPYEVVVMRTVLRHDGH